jgi:hypothetical protein
MARAAIAAIAVGKNTLQPALTALTSVDGGSYDPNRGAILKLVATASATVTIPSGLGASLNRVLTMANGETRYVRVDGTEYCQPDGLVYVNVSASSAVTAGVITAGFVDVGSA